MVAEVVDVLGGRRVVGDAQSGLELHEAVMTGLRFKALEAVGKKFGRSPQQLASALGIPATTYNRRRKAAHLDRAESEILVRLASVLVLGKEALGSFDAAARWLERPNRALGGAAPLSLLRTEVGSHEVEAGLTRLIYGGYG